jgi:DNA mismatch repair protein MutS
VTEPLRSILSDRSQTDPDASGEEAPGFFADLNLGQVVEEVVEGREEYRLRTFFHTPLLDAGAVAYRQEVARDLEQEEVFACVEAFTRKMRTMRAHLAQAERVHYQYQKTRWFFDAAEIYGEAVSSLADELNRLDLRSRGLIAFLACLGKYLASDGFVARARETRKVREGLTSVKYCVRIRNARVRVTRFESEADYSAEVEETFAKFKQAAAKDYLIKPSAWEQMDCVEARVSDFVMKLYPDVFRALDEYCARHRDYLDPAIAVFERETQFYVAYLEYIERFTSAGLAFCYPRVSTESKEISVRETFDLALANTLVPDQTVVCNDFYLTGSERVVIVTGPNQGGKTTFSRMFGQLAYLASLGLPVPGEEAALFLPDRVFTHFEREEAPATLQGRLEDELVRIHEILEEATGNSIIIMNESFTSTTLDDALLLGKVVMKEFMERDVLCVYVTFVDELASLGESTVSMVASVAPEDEPTRTFKIVRKPADGLAYATAIAEKYELTYDILKRRVGR